MLGTRSPEDPRPSPSAGNELEIAVPSLERLIEQFLSRVRGHNAALPITEVEARRIEAMLGALNLEVPRGTAQAGASVTDIARAAAGRLTPAQLATLPGLASANESTRRALPGVPRPGDESERRSAELRLNGIPLDAASARIATIKPGDRLEAKGAVHYPLRIGDALVEFRDESKLTVKEDELSLDEGQILVRTQENLRSPEADASPAPGASPSPAASPSAAPAPLRGIPRIAGASPAAPPPKPTPGPSGSPPSTIGRFKVGTPHAEMFDIGTAWVATAERRRSRAEVLMGKVLMKSKRTGAWVELDPGQFAWTEDDGTLVKRDAQLLIPSPGATAVVGSPASGASPGSGPPTPPEIADESTLIESGELPKASPAPGASGALVAPTPPPTPAPSASIEASPAPSASAAAAPTPQPLPDPQRNTPVLQGGFGNNASTPPVTPTPAPPDTE